MSCIVSIPDGRMAVGSQFGGIEIFTADVQLQQRVLKDKIILCLGFLSDGRYVVKSTNNILNLYTVDGEKLDVTFQTLSHDEGAHGGLTVSSDDHIYVSYRKPNKIQVFSQGGGKAIQEISCEEYEPHQLFAMNKTKRLVINSEYTVSLTDDDRMLHSVTVTKGTN